MMKSSEYKLVLEQLQSLPENSHCADCGCLRPVWASANLGIFICMKCAGVHRSMGTDISHVKSCALDTWDHKSIEIMKLIGNEKSNSYWESSLNKSTFKRPNWNNDPNAIRQFILNKYSQKMWAPDIPFSTFFLKDIKKTPENKTETKNNTSPPTSNLPTFDLLTPF